MAGAALDRTDISGLASEHVMERLKAIDKIARVGDSDALRLLKELQNSELLVTDTAVSYTHLTLPTNREV